MFGSSNISELPILKQVSEERFTILQKDPTTYPYKKKNKKKTEGNRP
jgi:hypothetical protein